MGKQKGPDYAGADNRRRFTVAEGEKREAWTEEDRKEFHAKCAQLKPFIDHLTTKVPDKKKSRWSLPVVE